MRLLLLTAFVAFSSTHFLTHNLIDESVAAVLQDDVIILNSFPKAGRYVDPTGKEFLYGITRTTVINNSETPLQVTIDFPADSFAILESSVVRASYLKLFTPPDTIQFKNIPFDKSSWYVNDQLKPFFDSGLKSSTRIQKNVGSKKDCTFYVGALYYQTGGVPTAELIMQGQNLFFRAGAVSSELFPCGKITRMH